MAATYAYFLAAAGAAEAEWLQCEMLARFKSKVATVCQDAVTDVAQASDGRRGGSSPARTAAPHGWELDWELAALASLRRLADSIDTSEAQARAAETAARELDEAGAAIMASAARRGWDGPAGGAPARSRGLGERGR